MKLGFAEKQFFKLRNMFFFAHAWTAHNPPKIYMWVGSGTWNSVFLTSVKKTEALQKNNFSSSEKYFFRACLDCFQVAQRNSNFRSSRLKSATLTIALQEPCFQGILLSGYLSFLWLQRAGFSMGCSCGKTIFQALFFSALLSWNTDKPGFANINFSDSKKSFFRMPLVKSANSTLLPRLSLLQVVQMHAIHN